MDPVFRTADLATHPTGVLAVGVHEAARAPGRASALPRESPAGRLDAATRGALAALLTSTRFASTPGA